MAEERSTRISFEDFTNATLNAIARAIEANKETENPLFRNPHIIIGIIWEPQVERELQQTSAKKLG